MTNLGQSKIRWGKYVQSSEDPTGPKLEGYTDQLSVAPGEQIGFHISTTLSKYSIEIARIGAQREVVWSKVDVLGVEHPVPDDASSHGCHWPPAFNLTVPQNWRIWV